jgi:hypothetical protein
MAWTHFPHNYPELECATRTLFQHLIPHAQYFEIACKRIEQAIAQGQLFASAPMKHEQGALI